MATHGIAPSPPPPARSRSRAATSMGVRRGGTGGRRATVATRPRADTSMSAISFRHINPATVFVVTDKDGYEGAMTWADVEVLGLQPPPQIALGDAECFMPPPAYVPAADSATHDGGPATGLGGRTSAASAFIRSPGRHQRGRSRASPHHRQRGGAARVDDSASSSDASDAGDGRHHAYAAVRRVSRVAGVAASFRTRRRSTAHGTVPADRRTSAAEGHDADADAEAEHPATAAGSPRLQQYMTDLAAMHFHAPGGASVAMAVPARPHTALSKYAQDRNAELCGVEGVLDAAADVCGYALGGAVDSGRCAHAMEVDPAAGGVGDGRTRSPPLHGVVFGPQQCPPPGAGGPVGARLQRHVNSHGTLPHELLTQVPMVNSVEIAPLPTPAERPVPVDMPDKPRRPSPTVDELLQQLKHAVAHPKLSFHTLGTAASHTSWRGSGAAGVAADSSSFRRSPAAHPSIRAGVSPQATFAHSGRVGGGGAGPPSSMGAFSPVAAVGAGNLGQQHHHGAAAAAGGAPPTTCGGLIAAGSGILSTAGARPGPGVAFIADASSRGSKPSIDGTSSRTPYPPQPRSPDHVRLPPQYVKGALALRERVMTRLDNKRRGANTAGGRGRRPDDNASPEGTAAGAAAAGAAAKRCRRVRDKKAQGVRARREALHAKHMSHVQSIQGDAVRARVVAERERVERGQRLGAAVVLGRFMAGVLDACSEQGVHLSPRAPPRSVSIAPTPRSPRRLSLIDADASTPTARAGAGTRSNASTPRTRRPRPKRAASPRSACGSPSVSDRDCGCDYDSLAGDDAASASAAPPIERAPALVLKMRTEVLVAQFIQKLKAARAARILGVGFIKDYLASRVVFERIKTRMRELVGHLRRLQRLVRRRIRARKVHYQLLHLDFITYEGRRIRAVAGGGAGGVRGKRVSHLPPGLSGSASPDGGSVMLSPAAASPERGIATGGSGGGPHRPVPFWARHAAIAWETQRLRMRYLKQLRQYLQDLTIYTRKADAGKILAEDCDPGIAAVYYAELGPPPAEPQPPPLLWSKQRLEALLLAARELSKPLQGTQVNLLAHTSHSPRANASVASNLVSEESDDAASEGSTSDADGSGGGGARKRAPARAAAVATRIRAHIRVTADMRALREEQVFAPYYIFAPLMAWEAGFSPAKVRAKKRAKVVTAAVGAATPTGKQA